MATIRKRASGYQVQIRKKGYRPLTNSFKDHSTAHAWAKKVESEIDRYIYLDISAAQRTTVEDVLDKFSKVVLPTKKSCDTDNSRIKTLKTQLGKYYLSDLNTDKSRIKTLSHELGKFTHRDKNVWRSGCIPAVNGAERVTQVL